MDLLLWGLMVLGQNKLYAVIQPLQDDANPAIYQGLDWPSHCKAYGNDRATIVACMPVERDSRRVTLYVSDIAADYTKNVNYGIEYIPDSVTVKR